jgi:SAM-dependent methyltransferase
MNLAQLARNIQPGADGVWTAPGEAAIRYPAPANQFCFQVEEKSFWFHHRGRCLLEVMRRFPPGGAFFDIGGGNGFTALALQNAGIDVVLVEPGPDGVRNARLRGVKNVVHSTLEGAGFLPGSMPAAGAFDVLEHIQNDGAFLRSLHDSLSPGGLLYLTVPALGVLWSQEDEEAGHCRRYTLSSLRCVLEDSGFEVEYATCLFQVLPPPIFVTRSIPWILGIRRSQAELEQRARGEHGSGQHAIISFLLDRELKCIASGGVVRFGSSCLTVAKRR